MRIFGIILLLLTACSKPEGFVDSAYFPDDFPAVANNQLIENSQIVRLGRQLFFEKALSANGKVSCGSCHLIEKSFTDGEALSAIGISGVRLGRHSPALINLAYMNSGLFWDGGAKNLESLIFAPLTHPDEMAADLKKVEMFLKADDQYAESLKSAFGVEEVRIQYAAKAIAQFLRTLVSDQSKYDSVRRKQLIFNEMEQKGYLIFKENCSGCHQEPLLTDNSYHNNGLDTAFSIENESLFSGRYRISHDEADIGKFKTPTLRNIALTAPYMHDGRFESLQEVLEHYASGIKNSATLAGELKNEESSGFNYTAEEKEQLKAFLLTLTDYNFIKIHKKEL